MFEALAQSGRPSMREEAEHQWQLAVEAREEAGMTSAEFERCRASGSYAENANL